MKKPFVPTELDLHVRGLLKLKNGTKSRNETHCYKLGKFIFDAEHATLRNEETDEKKSITERVQDIAAARGKQERYRQARSHIESDLGSGG